MAGSKLFRMWYIAIIVLFVFGTTVKSDSRDGKRNIADIVTRDGKKITNIKVVFPQADHIVVINNQGETKIDYRNLSAELQKRYKYNPEKARKARAKRRHLQQEKEAKQREREKRFRIRYSFIKREGIPCIFLEKHTLTPKSGGFVYLKKYQVIPVLYEKIALNGEIFKAPMEKLRPLSEFIADLKKKQQNLQHELINNPLDIERLQELQLKTTEKLAELLNVPKTFTARPNVANGSNTVNARPTAHYDPIVMAQINNLRKQIRVIKKRVRELKKHGPDEIKAEMEEVSALISKLEYKMQPYLNRKKKQKPSVPLVMEKNLNHSKTVENPLAEKAANKDTVNLQPGTEKGHPQKQSKANIKEKLRILKEMYNEKLITDKEYEQKKKELLSLWE